jgi:heat-inducible transcriptional repressor
MNSRQELILATIIKEYIKTGVPVSSHTLVDNYSLNVSSATIRNEMAQLEDEGLIIQPHTSAGRVPTEAAYKWYIGKLSESKVGAREAKVLANRLPGSSEADFKPAAKALAAVSGLAVFWAPERHNVYYTGLTNLLNQPEFLAHYDLICNLSGIIDSLDEIVSEYFDKIGGQPLILIGSEGPFGDACSSILIKYGRGQRQGAVGIFGPTRMDYERNLALMNYLYRQLI